MKSRLLERIRRKSLLRKVTFMKLFKKTCTVLAIACLLTSMLPSCSYFDKNKTKQEEKKNTTDDMNKDTNDGTKDPSNSSGTNTP